MKTILTLLVFVFSFGLSAQNQAADNKIAEIESFKKFESRIDDDKADLTALSDSVTEVIEVASYSRKSKTDLSSKVIEISRHKGYGKSRTYYFDDKSELFAVVDNLKYTNGGAATFTYYFGGGRLRQVLDHNKNDVTGSIDTRYLYYWIVRMFGDDVIAK